MTPGVRTKARDRRPAIGRGGGAIGAIGGQRIDDHGDETATEEQHEHGKDRQPVPQHVESEADGGEIRIALGNHHIDHIVVAGEIEEGERNVLLVVLALVAVGQVHLAIGQAAARVALAIQRVPILQRQGFLADLPVAPQPRPLPPGKPAGEPRQYDKREQKSRRQGKGPLGDSQRTIGQRKGDLGHRRL